MTRGLWNHNTHFHSLAVRAVSPGTTALDVGCGEGLLTRELRAAGAARVIGVDLAPEMVSQARERAALDPALEYRVADLLTMPVTERFDLVTCVATLHHVDLAAGLERLRELTAPGGRLVVVDPIVKAVRGYWEHPAPVADPEHSYAEIASTARRVLPGARFRRRLYYRYSLEWTAPSAS